MSRTDFNLRMNIQEQMNMQKMNLWWKKVVSKYANRLGKQFKYLTRGKYMMEKNS